MHEHPRLRKEWHGLGHGADCARAAWVLADVSRGVCGAVGREGRTTLLRTSDRATMGREESASTGQHVGHPGAGGEVQKGFFPNVYTIRFGSAKS